ncbi:MAG: LuxR C-terminal-related transcriptional regulator [Magnetospiraceae bacterium]
MARCCGVINEEGVSILTEDIIDWLTACRNNRHETETDLELKGEGDLRLVASYLGQSGPDEYLFRVIEINEQKDIQILVKAFDLTAREAEVLLWVAHGKSNKDIADILDLSPRTVNKHLEPIFTKLNVENRTTAASLAMRALWLE